MTHKSYEELRTLLTDAAERVAIDGLYRHNKSGGLYRVTGFVIGESDDSVEVVYCPTTASDINFSRSIDEFLENVDIDSQTVPRFEPVEPNA